MANTFARPAGPQYPYRVLQLADGSLNLMILAEDGWAAHAAYGHVERLAAPGVSLWDALDALDAGLDLAELELPIQPEPDPEAAYRVFLAAQRLPGVCVVVEGMGGARDMDVERMGPQARRALDVDRLEAGR